MGYASLSSQTQSILGDAPTETDGLSLEGSMPPDKQRTLDAIVLEVQRSLDYYESHFAKLAITSLVIAPLPYEIPGMIKYLASALGLQVRLLDMNAILDVTTPLSEKQQSDCFFAIAAALRAPDVNAQKSIQTKGEAA